jgi:hypothetical protein
MHHQRRWDSDEVGYGIADGGWLAPDVARLQTALSAPAWIAEQPELHLLPHIEHACGQPNAPWRLVDAQMDTAAVYHVRLAWLRQGENLRRLREDVFALIGMVAESVTYVHQHITDSTVSYDLCTGMLDDDSPFAPHGRLMRLTITGPAISPPVR